MSDISVPVIDRVIELQPARTLDVHGFTYIDKDKAVELFKPAVPQPLSIHTLSGFMGLLELDFEGFRGTDSGVFIQVESFDEVNLVGAVSDPFGRRQTFIKAKALPPERRFRFNEYMPQEEFNIGLRSLFVQTSELDGLVALAGNIAKEAEVRQQDDGFSQSVTAKAGVHLVREVVVKPRVTLKPFRTFHEVEQPDSDFIFRVQHSDTKGNLCALFEADGGRWKNIATETVRQWLTNAVHGSHELQVNALAVIA